MSIWLKGIKGERVNGTYITSIYKTEFSGCGDEKYIGNVRVCVSLLNGRSICLERFDYVDCVSMEKVYKDVEQRIDDYVLKLGGYYKG